MSRLPFGSILLGVLLALLCALLLGFFLARSLFEPGVTTSHRINEMVATFQVLLEVEGGPMSGLSHLPASWSWMGGLGLAGLGAAVAWWARRPRSGAGCPPPKRRGSGRSA